MGVIERHRLKSNGFFSILEEVEDVKKYHSHWAGTDDCIRVVNHATGEVCFKRIYENSKGRHFKHNGMRYEGCPSTMYIKDFTKEVIYVPLQFLEE